MGGVKRKVRSEGVGKLFTGFRAGPESYAGRGDEWTVEKGGTVRGMGQRMAMVQAAKQKMEEDKAARIWNDGRPMGKVKGGRVWLEKMERHPHWKLDPSAAHKAARVFAKFGLVEPIQRVFSLFRERQHTLDCHLYLELMKALKKRGKLEEAIAMYYIMQKRAIEPDLHVVTWLLNQCATAKRKADSLIFEQALLEKQVPLKAVSLCVLANAFGKLQDEQKVVKYYQEIEEGGFKKTTWIWTSLMDAFSRLKRYDMVDELFTRAKRSKEPLNAYSYCIAIDSFAERRQKKRMETALDDMAASGIRLDEHCMTSILNVYAKCEDVEGAETVYESILKRGGELGWIPSRIMLSLYATAGASEKALTFMEHMHLRGFPPRRRTYNLVLKAAAREGNYAAVRKMIRAMEHDGINPDAESYASVVVAIANAEEPEADRVMRHMTQMEESQIEKNVQLFNAEVFALLRFGQTEAALEICERMCLAHLQPNTETFEFIANGFLLAKNLHESVPFLVAMQAFHKIDEQDLVAGFELAVQRKAARVDVDAIVQQWRQAVAADAGEPGAREDEDSVDWVVEKV